MEPKDKAEGKPDENHGQGPGEAPDFTNLQELAGEEAANDYRPGEGAPAAPPPGSVGTKELQALYSMVFALASTRFGAHWQLTDAEARELSVATDAVLEKYGAKMAMGPEMALVLTGGLIVVPRAMTTAAMKPAKTEEKPDEKAGGAADGDQR